MALNFMGGIYIKEDTDIKNKPVIIAEAPAFITILLAEDAKAVVSAGGRVFQGSPIAINTDGFHIMSTISGFISQITDKFIRIDNDYKYEKQKLFKPIDKPLQEISYEEFINLIKNSGIVGAFSGVPAYRKIIAAEGLVHRVIINCIESDPESGCVNAFIRENAKEIIYGAKILMHYLGVKKSILAISINAFDAEKALQKHINDKSMIVPALLPSKYPQGCERMIISSVYNIETPLTDSIEKSGYSVFSCETAANIYKCLSSGEPVIRKIFTVTGEAVGKKNVSAYIGTPASELFADCPAYRKGEAILSTGGIMRGKAINGESPVTGNTNILRADFPADKFAGCCIRCGKCMDVCPATLVPFRLNNNFMNGQNDRNIEEGLFNCFECGACAYICPGRVDLLVNLRKAKNNLVFEEIDEAAESIPPDQTEDIIETTKNIEFDTEAEYLKENALRFFNEAAEEILNGMEENIEEETAGEDENE